MLRLATLIVSPVGNAWAAFDGAAVGGLYFDSDGSAHSKYDVSLTSGTIAIIHPDGIIGLATGLEEGEKATEYLDRIFI